MDKKMIRECGLEKDVERFQRILEYTFVSEPTLVDEDDDNEGMPDDSQQASQQPSPTPPASPAAPGGDSQPQATPQPDPAMGGGEQPQLPVEDIPTGEGEGSAGEEPELGIDIEDPSDGGGEEVTIDVDSLVKSQDETNAKLDSITDVFQSFFKVVDMYGHALQAQSDKLAELDTYIKKQNPTEEEILNIRSQSGAPFNQNPTAYWQGKQNDLPNYNVMMDNSVSPSDEQDAAKKEEKYDITVDDISDINTREVDASFDEPLTLDRFMKL